MCAVQNDLSGLRCTRLNFRLSFTCLCRLVVAMAASLRGLWSDWRQTASVIHRVNLAGSVRRMVQTVDGSPLAVQDRPHAILNADLVRPVLERMSDETTLKMNTVDDFMVQIICFSASIYDQPEVNEDNAMDIEFDQPSDEDDLRVLAMGMKRCVAFVRKQFLKPHQPRELGYKIIMSEHDHHDSNMP